VYPNVKARTTLKNFAVGNTNLVDFSGGAMWLEMASARPFIRATAE